MSCTCATAASTPSCGCNCGCKSASPDASAPTAPPPSNPSATVPATLPPKPLSARQPEVLPPPTYTPKRARQPEEVPLPAVALRTARQPEYLPPPAPYTGKVAQQPQAVSAPAVVPTHRTVLKNVGVVTGEGPPRRASGEVVGELLSPPSNVPMHRAVARQPEVLPVNAPPRRASGELAGEYLVSDGLVRRASGEVVVSPPSRLEARQPEVLTTGGMRAGDVRALEAGKAGKAAVKPVVETTGMRGAEVRAVEAGRPVVPSGHGSPSDAELFGALDLASAVAARKLNASERSALRKLAEDFAVALETPVEGPIPAACALCGPAADRLGDVLDFLQHKPPQSVQENVPQSIYSVGAPLRPSMPHWAVRTGLPDPKRLQLPRYAVARRSNLARRGGPPTGDEYDVTREVPPWDPGDTSGWNPEAPFERFPRGDRPTPGIILGCPGGEKRVKPDNVHDLGDACVLRLGSEFAGLPGDTDAPAFRVAPGFDSDVTYDEEESEAVLRTLIPEVWSRIDVAEAERTRLGEFIEFRRRCSAEVYARSPGGLFWPRAGRRQGYWAEAIRLSLRLIYANADLLREPKVPMEKGGYHDTDAFKRWMTKSPDWEVRYWARAGRRNWVEPKMTIHRLPDGAVAARRLDANGPYAYALRDINIRTHTKLEAALADYYLWWAVRIVRYCSTQLEAVRLDWTAVRPYGRVVSASYSLPQREALRTAAHGFLVAQMAARLGVRCVVDIGTLLVHEMGHIQTTMRAGSSSHCRSGSKGFDCTQYVAENTYMFGVCARYGLPRGPTEFFSARNAGYNRTGTVERTDLAYNRFQPGEGSQFLQYLGQGATLAWARGATRGTAGGQGWFEFVPSPAPCGTPSGADIDRPTPNSPVFLRILGERVTTVTAAELASAPVPALLPDVPRWGGSFGCIVSTLQPGSAVMIQHVFPDLCKSYDYEDPRLGSAWQVVVQPEESP